MLMSVWTATLPVSVWTAALLMSVWMPQPHAHAAAAEPRCGLVQAKPSLAGWACAGQVRLAGIVQAKLGWLGLCRPSQVRLAGIVQATLGLWNAVRTTAAAGPLDSHRALECCAGDCSCRSPPTAAELVERCAGDCSCRSPRTAAELLERCAGPCRRRHPGQPQRFWKAVLAAAFVACTQGSRTAGKLRGPSQTASGKLRGPSQTARPVWPCRRGGGIQSVSARLVTQCGWICQVLSHCFLHLVTLPEQRALRAV
eukprot:365468-Chlamydomonas_euryale.AAC.10